MPQATKHEDFADIGYSCAWAIPIPAVVLEGDTIVFANAAMLHMLGYENMWDLIGCNVERTIHPDSREASRSRLTIVEAGQRLAGVPSKLVTSAGVAIPVRITLGPIEVDGARLTLVQTHGVERRWPKSGWPEPPALRSNCGALAEAVLEALEVPVIVHTATSLLFANARARRQLGADTMEEIAGRPMLSVLHADSVFSTIERGVIFQLTRQPIVNVPVKLRGVNGATMRGVADAYPIMRGTKLIALVVGVGDAYRVED